MKYRFGPFYFFFSICELASFSVFILGIFLFLLFNKRWCYVFIIPITDSDHFTTRIRQRHSCAHKHTQCPTASLGNTAYFTLQHLGLFSFIGYCKNRRFYYIDEVRSHLERQYYSASVRGVASRRDLLYISSILALFALISPQSDVCSPHVYSC